MSYPSWTVTPTGAIDYVRATAAAVLNSQGMAQFTLAPVGAGADPFTVGYSGDRARATGGNQHGERGRVRHLGLHGRFESSDDLPFVEEANPPSSLSPYDGSQAHWEYAMPITVNTASGIPTGTVTFMDNSSTCPPGTSPSGVGAAYCLLANYSGQACPQAPTFGVQTLLNNGSSSTGAEVAFTADCLQMPEFTTYTPVVLTHYITPVYSGDANFLGATDSTSTLFQAISGPLVTINTSIPGALSAPISAPSLTVQSGSSASLTPFSPRCLATASGERRVIGRLQLPGDPVVRQPATARLPILQSSAPISQPPPIRRRLPSAQPGFEFGHAALRGVG